MKRSSSDALFRAAGECDLGKVKRLLREGADPNTLVNGMSPLTAVCARSLPSVDVVNALLEAGADPNLGETPPLPQAIANGCLEAVEALLRAGADVNIRDNLGQTALMAAAGFEPEMVPMLLEAGADPNLRDNDGKTALYHAMDYKNKEAVELLRRVTQADEWAERPWRDSQSRLTQEERLVKASAGGDVEFVRQLLRENVDVNAADANGTSALHAACDAPQPDVVELLVASGADVNTMDKSADTPLIDAARHAGASRMVRLLLGAGATVKANAHGTSPLHRAVKSGDVEVVQLLLDAGAEVNAKDEAFGFTPLHYAVENGTRASHGNTPAVVKLLLSAGADPNIINHKKAKQTPLHRAAMGSDLATVQALIAAGADPVRKDAKGRTAAELARSWGDEAVAEYLESL